MKRLGYVPALDGLRGIAILLVVATHYFGLPGGGPIGVGLFFVLSGFLITTLLLEEHSISGQIRLRDFYLRRARRLLPGLIALLIGYSAVVGLSGLRVVAIAGFYTANIAEAFWNPNPIAHTALAHLWTLAQEEQLYLVWPALLLVVVRTRRQTALVAALLVALIGYRMAYVGLDGGISVNRLYGPDLHADWLLAGVLLAFVRRRGHSIPDVAATAAFAALFIGLLLNPWTQMWFVWTCTLFLAASVALVGAAVSDTQMAMLLSARPLTWLGRISYSLYLWHVPVFAVFSYRHALLALPIAILVAWLSYRFVEQPFRRRRVSRSSTPQTTAVASAAR